MRCKMENVVVWYKKTITDAWYQSMVYTFVVCLYSLFPTCIHPTFWHSSIVHVFNVTKPSCSDHPISWSLTPGLEEKVATVSSTWVYVNPRSQWTKFISSRICSVMHVWNQMKLFLNCTSYGPVIYLLLILIIAAYTPILVRGK
jgi:hypothetical protein